MHFSTPSNRDQTVSAKKEMTMTPWGCPSMDTTIPTNAMDQQQRTKTIINGNFTKFIFQDAVNKKKKKKNEF
jgi:hypothetical protein